MVQAARDWYIQGEAEEEDQSANLLKAKGQVVLLFWYKASVKENNSVYKRKL